MQKLTYISVFSRGSSRRGTEGRKLSFRINACNFVLVVKKFEEIDVTRLFEILSTKEKSAN